jgi:predicted enzyme related to lactoylglutathione lyase
LNGGDDLAPMLSRVEQAGGSVVTPKTDIGNDFGFFAHFIDTEGNKVGLHSLQ